MSFSTFSVVSSLLPVSSAFSASYRCANARHQPQGTQPNKHSSRADIHDRLPGIVLASIFASI
jgi:hypothetical protein